MIGSESLLIVISASAIPALLVSRPCFSMLKERSTRQKPELSMPQNNHLSRQKNLLQRQSFQLKILKKMNFLTINAQRNQMHKMHPNLILSITSQKQIKELHH